MNIFISETVRARAIKFGETMSYYCTKIKFALTFSHASLRLRNLAKTIQYSLKN